MVTRYQRNLRVALKQYKGNMAIAHQVLGARGILPKYETRYRKRLKERLHPPLMWRITIAINYVVHSDYYSLRLQKWAKTKAELEAQEEELKEMAIKAWEKEIGWPKEQWPAPWQIGVGYQEVPGPVRPLSIEVERKA